MKILLSAYACEPNKGSEPGVGWNWALALAQRGYDVHVLTRSNNRRAIEEALAPSNLQLTFHYYDLPQILRFWKHWPGGIYLYYLLWQIGAYRVGKILHSTEQFSLVHHITFVSYRQPSFMGGLGIPFIFGPVGGRDHAPAVSQVSSAPRSADRVVSRYRESRAWIGSADAAHLLERQHHCLCYGGNFACNSGSIPGQMHGAACDWD